LSNGCGKLVLMKLQKATGLSDFEEARKNWDFTGIVESENNQFVDHCELCNASGLGKNYIIQHQNTLVTYRVGSKCIKRYIQLGNAETQEDSNRRFERKCNQLYALKTIPQLLLELFEPQIKPDIVTQFRQKCAILLDCSHDELKDKCTNSDVPLKYLKKELLKSLREQEPDWEPFDNLETERIRLALVEPKYLPVIRAKNTYKYTGMIKKRHRVTTSLSNSESYKDPLKLIIEKEKD
jgi:hypothetical protein